MLGSLRVAPGRVSPRTIELALRLSLALRSLQDPEGANRWLHHRWHALFETMAEHVGPWLDAERGFDHLSLGAGTRNFLTLPFLVHLAGARRTWVVEPEAIRPGEEWRWVWGLQEAVLRVLTGSLGSKRFVRSATDLGGFVDAEALFFGPDPGQALNRDGVRLVPALFEDAEIPPRTIGLLSSRSVLEHTVETERCFDKLAELVAPGGVMWHGIDLTAHAAADPFVFYYQAGAAGGSAPTDGLNGLRLTDYLRAFEARGFESRVVDRRLLADYPLERSRLLPRYRHYGDDDLRCARAVIVSRRCP
jgi:hypothetical protein